jgi:hypothetical protein
MRRAIKSADARGYWPSMASMLVLHRRLQNRQRPTFSFRVQLSGPKDFIWGSELLSASVYIDKCFAIKNHAHNYTIAS